jgi:hypothetical protein
MIAVIPGPLSSFRLADLPSYFLRPHAGVSGRPPHLERPLSYAKPERGTPETAALSYQSNGDGGVLGPLADFPQANAAGECVPDRVLEGSLPPCPHIDPAFRALILGEAAHGNLPITHVPRGDAGHQQPKIPDVPRIITMINELGHSCVEWRAA